MYSRQDYPVDELVANTEILSYLIKQRLKIALAVGEETCEFEAINGLHTFNFKLNRISCVMLFKLNRISCVIMSMRIPDSFLCVVLAIQL